MKKHIAKMPNGMTVFCPSGNAYEHQKIIDGRDRVVRAYCEKHGWSTDLKELTIDQILIIRDTEEWKSAGRVK